ncbi:MAG TPA: aldo/keto reductase, partial [Bacteroidia bacterium]|nr:aldo/keto reductase [Bacteroidia bacterium]
DQIMQAYKIAREYNMVPPSMEQPQYNLFHREKVEKEFAKLYSEIGLGTTIWSPLASGMLTGKYNDGIPKGTRLSMPNLKWLHDSFTSEEGKVKIEKTKKLTKLALDMGTNVTYLSLAWCLKNPNVSTVILGASKVEQLKENLKCLEAKPLLTSEVMKKIEEILA